MQKCMKLLDFADPEWRVNDPAIAGYIKDQMVHHMSRRYSQEDLVYAQSAASQCKIRNKHLNHIEAVMSSMEKLDPSWRTSIPGMIKKIKFDVKHGKGLRMPLF